MLQRPVFFCYIFRSSICPFMPLTLTKVVIAIIGCSILTFVFALNSVGQARPSRSPIRPTPTPTHSQVEESRADRVNVSQEMYNKILSDSGRYFKEGLEALRLKKKESSGEEFDKVVEVFLRSSINIQRD